MVKCRKENNKNNTYGKGKLVFFIFFFTELLAVYFELVAFTIFDHLKHA